MAILIINEYSSSELSAATLSLVTAAQQLSSEIHVLVTGQNCHPVVEKAALIQGVTQIFCADAPAYAHGLAENTAALVASLAKNYTHVLAASTTFGKNLLPRAAALLDVAPISDVIAIKSADTFVRPVYAGNAIATVQMSDAIKLMTVRASAFTKASLQTTAVPIKAVTEIFDTGLTTFVKQEVSPSERPELGSARVVISGGRGLQNGENFALLNVIADKLHAAIGASRAAVDAGFVPNDYQVGQTGKIVAPDLYIAVGISGAIQHLAGMKDSKVIVAINKDPDAPIFQVADYGLVADLFEALPELAKELDKLG